MSMQAAASVSLDIFCEPRCINWLSAFCQQSSLPEIFLADVLWKGEIGGSDPVRFGRRNNPHIADRPHKVFEQETLIRTACSPSPVTHHSAAGVRLGRPPPWVDRSSTSAAIAPASRCRQRAPPTCPRSGRPRRALHWRTSAAPPARRQCRPVGCVAQTAPPESARRAHTTGWGRSCPARRPGRVADVPRAAGEAIYCRQCFVVTHGMRYPYGKNLLDIQLFWPRDP